MPAISVIIPAYNRAHCLVQTLESVFAQTFSDYEVLVINDGSTDNTREVLAPFHERLRVIHQENRGLAAARNRGVREAQGEWIAFLDSDDLWLPEKLEIQMAELQSRPGSLMHVTNCTIVREHLGSERNYYEHTGFRAKYPEEALQLDRPFVPNILHGLAWMQCALIHRTTFEKAGPFIPEFRVWMDFEMGARLALIGPWLVSQRPLVRILRQDEEVSSISSLSQTLPGQRELVGAYEKMAALLGLNKEEWRFISRRLSDARGSLGLRLLSKEAEREARQLLRKSFKQCPRVGSMAKLCYAYAPPFCRSLMDEVRKKIRAA